MRVQPCWRALVVLRDVVHTCLSRRDIPKPTCRIEIRCRSRPVHQDRPSTHTEQPAWANPGGGTDRCGRSSDHWTSAALSALSSDLGPQGQEAVQQRPLSVTRDVRICEPRISGDGNPVIPGSEASLKFLCEQKTSKLRLRVRPHGRVAAAAPMKIIKCHPSEHMGLRHHRHHTISYLGRSRFVNAKCPRWFVPSCRSKPSIVVDGEPSSPRIIDQYVDRPVPILSEPPHRGKVTQVEVTNLCSRYLSCESAATTLVAHSKDHRGSGRPDSTCDHATDSPVAPVRTTVRPASELRS